jgi:hypothetical protein
MQVGPCIPVRTQLQKTEVGPTSGPTSKSTFSPEVPRKRHQHVPPSPRDALHGPRHREAGGRIVPLGRIPGVDHGRRVKLGRHRRRGRVLRVAILVHHFVPRDRAHLMLCNDRLHAPEVVPRDPFVVPGLDPDGGHPAVDVRDVPAVPVELIA